MDPLEMTNAGHVDGERCRFPSCTRRTFLHAHHIRFWRYGGLTDLPNDAFVCGSEGGRRCSPAATGLKSRTRRARPLPADTIVVVRGGRDTADKLLSHAQRTARAWSLDGQPLLGISVFAVLDRPLAILLRDRFSTFRTVYMPTVGGLVGAGFELLPTGRRPHFTVRLRSVDETERERLLVALGAARDNPAYGQTSIWPEEG